LERRRREPDPLDQHVAHADQRAVIEARIFGQFSGQKRSGRDTTKGSGDTKDRSIRSGRDTEDGRERDRGDESRDDGGPLCGWERSLLGDAFERTRLKRNRSARPTRIGGFAKGARTL
jgi:hypothetical protein